MDSLLANYASSDEEEEQLDNQQPPQPGNSFESLHHHKPPSSSLFSSLPKPQSSSLFTSLPPPKSNPKPQREEEKELPRDSTSGSKASSGLFSALPAPKSRSDSDPISSSTSKKRVVQFRPPLIQPSALKPDDDDDDDNDEEFEKKKPQTINPNSSFKSFLSSMPAPANSTTLGVMSGSGGSGRRAIVETAAPTLNSDVYKADKQVGISYDASSAQHSSNDVSVAGPLGPVEDQYGGGSVAGDDGSNWGQTSQSYVGYEGYESYPNYGAYTNYEGYGNDGNYDHNNNWANASSAWVTPEASETTVVDNVPIVPGKRGRNQVPTEIVEVNQDELMKNRPREDKVKLTGIAFGPAYQAAPSGIKPTKLHKRKHQIGSLYFDMRQKEMELAERRAKGMLTKAETQAKYGW